MIERKVATRTVQIVLDSRYKKSGTDGDYVINLRGVGGQPNTATQNTYSNVFFSNFEQVVGIKVLGVFLKDTAAATTLPVPASPPATAIDIVCPQIPKKAQQLQAQHGYVWSRVPLIRNYNYMVNLSVDPGATSVLIDQWWESPPSNVQLFPPQEITELSISLWTNEPTPVIYENHPNYLLVEMTVLDRPQDV
jgi:hypothetical protein